MEQNYSRRELFKKIKTGAIISTAGYLALNDQAYADLAQTKSAKRGVIHDGKDAVPARLIDGKIVRPSVTVPTIEETDVLVVGGGAAGCTAAIAAARAGVKVTLVERYNHFGGLVTGGLVFAILGHWANKGSIQVIRGIGEEMMRRLESLPYGITPRKPGKNQSVDGEAYKFLLLEMLTEANVSIYLHSFVSDAIVEGNVIKGAVIQSKIGPKAILAKMVIDTTGDGDVYAAAGAAYDRRDYHIGLPYRIANIPRPKKGEKRPRNLGGGTPIKDINWVNMGGKTTDGIDPKGLSEMELEYRKKIWQDYLKLRSTKGYEKVEMVETAPQLGVRITRVLKGVKEMKIQDVIDNKKFDDCVGIGGAWGGDHQPWQLPYGALVSENIENMMTAGRSVSTEPRMSDLIRVIAPCWLSGHAAGCAAACAIQQDTTAKKVDLKQVRELLLKQGAYLG